MSSSTDSSDRNNRESSSDDDYYYGSWRNVFSIVQKWKATFNGDRHESIKDFLISVKSHQQLTDLGDSELLEALPCLLTEPALVWHRLIPKEWTSWEHFCEDARNVFRHSEKYNLELLEKALARKQTEDESAIDYVSELHRLAGSGCANQTLVQQHASSSAALRPRLSELVEEQEAYEPPPAPEDSTVYRNWLTIHRLKVYVGRMKFTPEVEGDVSGMIDEKLKEKTGDRRSVSGVSFSSSGGARRCYRCE
ncbi:uncharacterized protein LOC103317887 isoform X2 [Nasonia vitripennis]|nr:uncharacterized protein LOC103317887 isoform X2 [Nasonia vitripennis]